MVLQELLTELPYQVVAGDAGVSVTDLVYDSRRVTPGCLFICISGSSVDAHDFLPQVAAGGAAAVIVEKDVPVPAGVTVIRVESTRRALALVSAAWFGHPARRLRTIGITGTKGKTTTAHMIRAILIRAGYKVGMMGTNGIFIGEERIPSLNTTPESYLVQKYMKEMADAGCDYLVMEVSSQGLMMDRVAGFTFDLGLFTNISPDHIGPNEHASFEEYLYWKKQLLARCRLCAVNRDDEHFEQITEGAACEVRTYSMERPADVSAGDVRYIREGAMLGTAFTCHGKREREIRVNLPGRFNAVNALSAVAVLEGEPIPDEAFTWALEHTFVKGRMELVCASHELTVIVDYAHNAVSMQSLLETLREYDPGRLVCVFGCGGNRSKLRRFEMGEIGGRMADLSIITADNSRWEKVEDILADIETGMHKTTGVYEKIPDRRTAIRHAISEAREGDMVVIIGKGHEDYQEVEGVRTHFSDREEAEEALKLCGKAYLLAPADADGTDAKAPAADAAAASGSETEGR